ncbi:MAG TPA: ABC transporter ATP-binding protein [Deinococcales bacterium]|nr:ABC transporter ATP-binding protein [Deinococcales bacterium]
MAAVTAAPPALEALDLRAAYPGPTGLVEVLHGISLQVSPGVLTAVVGPSGSGKSTLLHLLGGLDVPSGGEVRWAGRSLRGQSVEAVARRRARETGFIFQHHYLLEDLTVLQNVNLPSLVLGTSDEARARDLLARVGLAGKEGLFPRALSGGERQRAALARALQSRPEIVLADEPTGSLDRPNARQVFDLLLNLARLEGAAVVVVTHDEPLAALADRVLSLEDGRIVHDSAAALTAVGP